MADPATPKRKFHWSRVVLVISLGLNLAILGLIFGAMLRFRDGPPPPRDLAARDVGYGAFIAALDRGDRRALARAYVGNAPSTDEIRREYRTQLESILTALRADPYQPASLEAAIALRTSELAARQTQGRMLLVERIHEMDADERLSYANRLEEIIRRGPRKLGGKPDYHDRRD